MALLNPVFIQALPYSAQITRGMNQVFHGEGVLGPTGLKVTQRAAGTNMSVDVAAGQVVIEGTDVTFQNPYLCQSTAVTNVILTAAPGTGLSRYDIIYAQVRDAAANAGPNNDWIITKATGTAASSNPAEPVIPATATPLARVLVAAGTAAVTNAMITDYRYLARAITPMTAAQKTMRSRYGQLVIEEDSGIIRKGAGLGTWQDISNHQVKVTSGQNPIFGTLPVLASTQWKTVAGATEIGFVNGGGTLTLPVTLTGILTVSLTVQAALTPMSATFRSNEPVTGNSIPVGAWRMDGLGGGAGGFGYNGALNMLYNVLGW